MNCSFNLITQRCGFNGKARAFLLERFSFRLQGSPIGDEGL